MSALPVAIRMKESLVEVSPSTVMQLKERAAACATAVRAAGNDIRASQATKPSIVAMLGRIMPAPLAMPVTVTVAAADCGTRRDAALGSVSVVMMACAAASQLSDSQVREAGRQARGDSLHGQRLHDDAGRKRQHLRRSEHPRSRASSLQVRRAAASAFPAGAGVGVTRIHHQRPHRRGGVEHAQVLARHYRPAPRRSDLR